MMTPWEIEQKMMEYEGLVIATTRYWRDKITTELSDEDIEQELRMKVWKALERFDPTRGYPERNHVFGYVRNRVKDLIDKKHREHLEVAVNFTSCERTEFLESAMESVVRSKLFEESEKAIRENTDLLTGLRRGDQVVAILMTQGFNIKEMSEELCTSTLNVRRCLGRIRAHIRGVLDERERSQRPSDG